MSRGDGQGSDRKIGAATWMGQKTESCTIGIPDQLPTFNSNSHRELCPRGSRGGHEPRLRRWLYSSSLLAHAARRSIYRYEPGTASKSCNATPRDVCVSSGGPSGSGGYCGSPTLNLKAGWTSMPPRKSADCRSWWPNCKNSAARFARIAMLD